MKLKESEVEQHRGMQEAKIKYQMSMADKCNITLLTYSCFHNHPQLPQSHSSTFRYVYFALNREFAVEPPDQLVARVSN
jgi:hypothetical protein